MRLSEEDYYQFLNIHKNLLLFAGKATGLVKSNASFEEFVNFEPQKLLPIREALYSDADLIDAFADKNPANLSAEDLEIVRQFRHSEEGTFYIYKMLKKHNIFLKDSYAYAVSALSDPLKLVMGGAPLPIMVEAVLLPFKGRIVYDGFLLPYSIRFGGGMKSSLKQNFDEALARNGLIETLPINLNALPKFTAKDQLDLWMKTENSRHQYWDEIQGLVKTNPDLRYYYTSLWSKVFARKLKKNLKENGVKGHFAVYDESVIASALTKKELEKRVREFLSAVEAEGVYFFKL